MSSNNILEPIPAALNDYLLKYNQTTLGDLPAAPNGSTNVVFQKDQFGNISAYTSGGGSSITLETNGAANSSQVLLNLAAGANVTLTETGGTVTVASTGGGGSVGSAGQLQMVGSTAGSFAASPLVDDVGGNTVFSSGAIGAFGQLNGPFTSVATLDFAFDGARFIAWGASASDVAGLTFAGLSSDASITNVYLTASPSSIIANINGVAYFSLAPSLVTLGVSGTPTLVDTLQITNPVSATSATAGSATALPATPEGYMTITLAGVARKIAYYAV